MLSKFGLASHCRLYRPRSEVEVFYDFYGL